MKLDKRAAYNIVEHRDGPDATPETSDDDLFDSIAELDDISYVGNTALSRLRDYAIANGYLDDGTDPPPVTGRPDLSTPVQYDNTWCSYADSPPYVRDVDWDNAAVKAAMRALTAGFRSTFSYSEWRVAYDLEYDNSGSDEDKAFKRARNFIRVICGEHRDYPDMIAAKLGRHRQAHQHGRAA